MTTAELDPTASVRDLLFGGAPGGPADALAESLHEHGTIASHVPRVPGLTAVVEREMATATDGLLSLDLADIVAAGWTKCDALRQAARRTRDAPEEIVVLATHKIESSHRPTVELFIDGRSIAVIEIELQIALTMAGVCAVVQQGRLTEIRCGTCTVSGFLAMQRTVIAKRQRQFDLPGAIRLRHGVALHGEPSTRGAWYSDPTRRYEVRWWDGSCWTQRVATNGRATSDPLFCETSFQ